MNDNRLNNMQKKLLDMFSWFHEYCSKNNLRYYCLGGTMLGAVRHKGFIPWDDDIDVGMPRKDYEILIKLMKTERKNKYYLESPTKSKDYLYSYCKLYDTETTLVENMRYKLKRGIYIDIFPLDGLGETKLEAEKNYKKILPYLNFLAARNCSFNLKRKLYKNLAILLARLIPECIFPTKKVIEKIIILSKQRDFDGCTIISNIDGNWRRREIMEREIFGKPKLYKFNDLEVYGVSDSERYLTNLYGDWRKLPPKEEQKSHHDYIVENLEKSYLD